MQKCETDTLLMLLSIFFFKSYIIYEDMYWIDRKMIYKWFEK